MQGALELDFFSSIEERMYLCVDLKSFYASVECVDRGLDPLKADLVVADPERGEMTICLAVSPALKAKGVRNRCRIFDIPAHLHYMMAAPRMQRYVDVSADIYEIYLKYVSPEDIHVYSIDECFLDITSYLALYGCTARQMARQLMHEVLQATGIRATCGIGTNLYLAKVALDITAKRAPDFIGELNEESYRQKLWQHRPLTDFWQVGPGISRRLESCGITTMEGIAHADEERLYRLLGINAELLIDHAWGIETTTIRDIRSYQSSTQCLCRGQVLPFDYPFEKGLLIIKEMMDRLCLELVEKSLVSSSVTLYVGYSGACGPMDSAHGTTSVTKPSNADAVWVPAIERLYQQIVRRDVPVRRLTLCCNDIHSEDLLQFSLLDADSEELQRNRKLQKALSGIHLRYGRNAVLKGTNYEEGATARERNHQIGGHRSGV